METNLLAQYDKQQEKVRLALEAESDAKGVYDKAVDARRAEEAELHRLRSVLERAISAVDPDHLETRPLSSPPAPIEQSPAPDGVRQSLWELLLCIPVDGDVEMDTFRERFKISDGAINSRIAKAKKRKYIETAGWGRYKLTDKGKELVERRGLRLLEADE